MNTIEERAIEAAQDFTYTELDAGTIIEEHTHGEYNAYKQGFCDGVTDQHKIYIDKACKWLRDNGCFSYLQEGSQTIEYVENIFRKAMED